MSLLTGKIGLSGSKGKEKAIALYDSGASMSFIKKNIAEKLANLEKLPTPFIVHTAKEGEDIEITSRVSLDFYIDEIRFSDEFYVSDLLTEDVIIGAATMQKWRFKLDYENERVLIDPKVTYMRI